jgi:hypothetical protein
MLVLWAFRRPERGRIGDLRVDGAARLEEELRVGEFVGKLALIATGAVGNETESCALVRAGGRGFLQLPMLLLLLLLLLLQNFRSVRHAGIGCCVGLAMRLGYLGLDGRVAGVHLAAAGLVRGDGRVEQAGELVKCAERQQGAREPVHGV